MDLEMTIEQGDNGWILTYEGHDGLDKTIVCTEWSAVLTELEEYFGWENDNGGNLKKNPDFD